MLFSILFLFSLSLLANGAALTTALSANERLCFYADVDKAGEKLGVRVIYPHSYKHLTLSLVLLCCMLWLSSQYTSLYFTCKVQSGGSFDIDFDIRDPNNKLLLDGQRERQGDYVLTANTVGEYAFCFENDMSTLTEKLVDFDIMVESDPRYEAPAKPGQIADQTSALEESVFRLSGMLLNIKRMQKQYLSSSFVYDRN